MNRTDLSKKIKDLLVLKQDDGTYHLFGQYHITKDSDNLYTVNWIKDSTISIKFGQLKYAVTWCVFHKNNKYKDINKIAELDETLDSLSMVITNHKRLAEKNVENRPIYLAKLSEDKIRRKEAQKAMDYYVEYSKYWQNKTFKEYTSH